MHKRLVIKTKAMFDDLLYNNSIGAKGDDRYAGTNPKSIGNGVKMSGTVTDYTDGTITLTGGKTQAAMEGNGFFVVGDSKAGNMEFTRKGTFTISSDYYITNTEGQYVFAYPADPSTGNVDLSGIPGPLQVPMGSAIGGIRTSKGVVGGTFQQMQNRLRKNCLYTIMPVIHGQCAWSLNKMVNIIINIKYICVTNRKRNSV